MMLHIRLRFSFGLLGLLLLAPLPFACGPEPMALVFTGIVHPDAPRANYFKGEIGVLQPTYARVYLFAAYRYLSGAPLTSDEGKIVAEYWGYSAGTTPPAGQNADGSRSTWLDRWTAERRKLDPGAKPLPGWGDGVFRLSQQNGYVYFMNCPAGAFRNATLMLADRAAKFGPASFEVQQWVAAQDQVFNNCAGLEKNQAQIPPTALAGWNPLLRADRAYQIGAALFYSGQFDAAAKQFDEIARDAASPWKTIAPYLAARALIRKGTLSRDRGFEREPLLEAEHRLSSLMANPKQSELHAAARRLLNFTSLRLRPNERRKELARILLSPQTQEDKAQALVDYTRLMDSDDIVPASDLKPEVAAVESARRYAEANSIRDEPLTDWILTYQAQSPEARERAIQKWKETQSPLWLVAAISKADAKHAEAAALHAAAGRIGKESPAYATVAFHSVRLLMEAGKTPEARSRIDGLLTQRALQNPSAQNLLRAARMKAANSLGEVAAYAPRPVRTGIWNQSEADESTDTQFDVDFSDLFNRRLPLQRMVELVSAKKLPEALHRSVVLAAWTRAILLGRHDVALAVCDEVERVAPTMKYVLRDYRAAATPDTRRYVATYAVLSFPPLTPYVHVGPERKQELQLSQGMDHWRDNWWCNTHMEGTNLPPMNGWRAGYTWNSMPLRSLYPTGSIEAPAFLAGADAASVEKETKVLAELIAPNYLTQVVMEWAKAEPKNALVPEALHRAVNAARWGCGNQETAKYSKAAFEMLHRNYPKSRWAKTTKYWYEGNLR